MVKKRSSLPSSPTKETAADENETFAARLPSLLQYHANMLGDERRNRLLTRAIKKSVVPGSSFLDVGAGTGTWAILAAKLGAERVVAIEAEQALIPIIHRNARENGVDSRIEIIHGRSDDVRIGGRFSVVVSELFDGNAFGRATIDSFRDLRHRFLAKDGILIPVRLELMAVPVAYLRKAQTASGEPSFFDEIRYNYSRTVGIREHDDLIQLADPTSIYALDLAANSEGSSGEWASGEWRLRDLSKADGVLTFPRSTFLPGLEMSGIESQSWAASFYPFERLPKGKGLLRFDLTMLDEAARWVVSAPGLDGQPAKTYSPIFAFTRLKTAHSLTPHRRFHPRKK